MALPRFIVSGLDYTSALALRRVVNKVSQKARMHDRQTKIAVLGSFTTHQLVWLLELYLQAARVKSEIYEADYGTFRQEIFDPTSELTDFSPISSWWPRPGVIWDIVLTRVTTAP